MSSMSKIRQTRLAEKRRKEKDDVGCFGVAIAVCSFIPLIGVPIGIISAIWGFFKWNSGGKKLVGLGVAGVLFTVGLYTYLFFMAQQTFSDPKIQAQIVKPQLVALIKSIEYFKIQNERYPETLQELREKSKDPIFIEDPSGVQFQFQKTEPRLYYYEIGETGDFYYLLSVGKDNLPFTADDILPDVSESEMGNIGYRVKP